MLHNVFSLSDIKTAAKIDCYIFEIDKWHRPKLFFHRNNISLFLGSRSAQSLAELATVSKILISNNQMSDTNIDQITFQTVREFLFNVCI